jgi:hypothetical protein
MLVSLCYNIIMNGWNACTMEPNSILRWIECHPAFVGWAQTVALIATILVMLVISRTSARDARLLVAEQRLIRARATAIRMAPVIADIYRYCKRAREFSLAYDHGLEMQQDLKTVESTLHIPVDLPKDVLLQLDAFEPDAATALSFLFQSVWRYNSFVEIQVPLLRTFDATKRSEYAGELGVRLERVEKFANNSYNIAASLTKIDEW